MSLTKSTIQFPIVVQQSTDVANYLASIRQSMQVRLGTLIGSVAFDRNFGSKLYYLLFEANTDVFKSLAYTYIREAIQNETRITIQSIDIDVSQTDIAECYITYTVKQYQSIDQIQYNINRTL